MSNELTEGIRVQVHPEFIPHKSSPTGKRFVFRYKVRITNEGSVPVRLVARRWVITDATGHVEHVQGPGVVGNQPLLMPEGSHEYESFCPLPTPLGSMEGSYRMVRPDGTAFDARVGTFVLSVPSLMH